MSAYFRVIGEAGDQRYVPCFQRHNTFIHGPQEYFNTQRPSIIGCSCVQKFPYVLIYFNHLSKSQIELARGKKVPRNYYCAFPVKLNHSQFIEGNTYGRVSRIIRITLRVRFTAIPRLNNNLSSFDGCILRQSMNIATI